MPILGSYGTFTYGYGVYGGTTYPTVDVELTAATVTITLEDDTIDMELTE